MRRRLALLAAVVALAVVGCSDSPAEGPDGSDGDADGASGTVLRLVIPDGNIRPEGAECDGARPYRYVHQGVEYSVESGDGAVLVEGELPVGRAENADPSIDWEDLERIPTVCIMELAVGDLPEHPEYGLRIADDDPISFSAEDVAIGTPIVLVVGD
jgi:hypothetical protein